MDLDDIESVSGKLNTKKVNKNEKVQKEVPYLFEKEVIIRKGRCFPVDDRFVPMRKVFPITDKFYSKYEQTINEPHNLKKCKLENQMKSKSSLTVLESQRYGWIPKQIDKRLIQQLNFINAPKRREDITIYGEKLFCEKVTQRPKFNGIRFFLQ